MEEKDLALAAIGRLQSLMGDGAVSMEDLLPGPTVAIEPGEQAELYRAVFATPQGQAVLVDMVARLCLRGAWAPGADPTLAVYDLGMRAVVADIIYWTQQNERETNDEG
jgi:hypothetical protein